MQAGSAATGEFADVSRLLAPRTVAIIGASDQPGNVGGAAVRFFGKFASPCTVWPVNHGRDTVAGLPCYKSVADLPAPADLAITPHDYDRAADAVNSIVAGAVDLGSVGQNGVSVVDPTRYLVDDRA